MGLVGKEIIQSRLWLDPSAPKPPELNYKDVYPITVYEAVKETMDENSKTLKQTLDSIHQELLNKQPIFSAKPAEYLMTFAGIAGGVGSIITTRDIPWDPTKQRHDRIPTEKAVGDLMLKLGLIDKNGNIDPKGGTKVDWKNVIGRPELYEELGMHDDGFVTQKGATIAINNINTRIDGLTTDCTGKFNIIGSKIDNHLTDRNNPHNVTIDQIGGVSNESFQFHTNNHGNPHNVTKIQIGLDNVDNTSDINKPISKATQQSLDIINNLINDLYADVGNVIVDIKYDQPSGILRVTLKNGSIINLLIPINGLIDEIRYDKDSKQLLAIELGGHINKIDISELFIRYLGGITSHITIEVDDTKDSGIHVVNATINPTSINDTEMANDSVITRIIKDQNVTTEKIKDLSITTIKLDDKSVTTEKIAKLAVTTINIADRSIIGRTLFSSTIDNRILGVLAGGSDPAWIQVNSSMIADNAIRSIHLFTKSVITDKLDDKAVTTVKLDDFAVATEKIGEQAVTDEKIKDFTISGTKMVDDILLPGTPRIIKRPLSASNNNQIPDTFWVTDKLDKAKMRNDNIIDRAINGRTLFSPSTSNRALVVLAANSDPVWDLINNGMMGDNSVGTNNIIDLSITDPKLANSSIISRHIRKAAVLNDHINEGAVDSTKIWKSEIANRVLAVLRNDTHPIYTQINREMLLDNVIGTKQVEDRSITLSKLTTSDKNNRILGAVLQNTDPVWVQANNGMLANRSVDGRVLFTSGIKNRVLVVLDEGSDPAWLQINGDMIKNGTINGINIANSTISNENLKDKIVSFNNIMDHTIKAINIAPREITGSELFTSPVPNRVLAVTGMPYSDPTWMQINTDMIGDKAVTREKIFQSEYDYRVLGVTQANVPPEYLRITSDFIVDDSIIPTKLVRDFILFGVPEMTEHPPVNANNRQIADTYWVRKTVANMIKDFNPKILFDTVSTEMIQNRGIDGTKLFSYAHAPRVLGITEPNGDPEYILIEENLIADGAVTKSKIQKDITLLGSPTIETRPFPNASDAIGGGSLIPDCQWVLNAIGSGKGGTSETGGGNVKFDPEYFVETTNGVSLNIVNITTARAKIDELFTGYSGSGDPLPTTGGGSSTGGTGSGLSYESVETDYIANRAVTGDKLFTSSVPNRLLGVLSSNSSAQYIQANNDMIEDRAINGRTLFTSQSANKVLGVMVPGSNPSWMQINYDMIENNAIGTFHIKDDSVINQKIADRSINGRTLFSSNNANRILGVLAEGSDPIWMRVNYDMIDIQAVGTIHLENESVTMSKIADYAVTQMKLDESPIIDTVRIVDKNVTSIKIADQGIENQNIKDHTIQGDKLVENIKLPGHPTVAPDSGTSYQTRQLRNTIISADAPSGGEDGDIWLRYI